MKKLLTILLAVMFLVAPIALAEDVTNETTQVNTSEQPSLIATNNVSETNISETDSEAIANTISSSDTGAAQNVSVTPDMPLRWGLKTWTEKLDLLLTFNKFKKAEKELVFARERLQEMKQMADKKNLKALAKAQIAHAELVAGLVKDEETLGSDNLTAVDKIQIEVEKHIQVLNSIEAKLQAKGIPTKGVENALNKSRNAFEKFQNMSETRKAKLFEKVVAKAQKVETKRETKKAEGGSEKETNETSAQPEEQNSSLNSSCIDEGNSLGAVVPDNHNICCEGLTRIATIEPKGETCIINGTCTKQCITYVGNEGYCTKCGDGLCKDPENFCNCPEDCKS